MCYIVVSTETPQTSNAALRVQTSTFTPTPLQVLTSKTPPPTHTHTAISSAFCADALQM